MLEETSEQVEQGFWRVEDVAKYLNIEEETARKWAQRGKIPCVRLGPRTLRFIPSQIRDWAESMRVQSQQLAQAR